MTTSARAKRGLYRENPPTNEPCAKQCKKGYPVIPAIQSAQTNMPLWKAVASAGALGPYCDPLHAAPFSSGDTVQGLNDARSARCRTAEHWATAAASRNSSRLFAAAMSAIYADRFGSYAGQKLVVNGEQPAPSGGMVRSQIIKANGEPVKVDYMMRLSGDNWLISEVATRRSEFATILKTEGVDGLTSALNRRAEALAISAARTF